MHVYLHNNSCYFHCSGTTDLVPLIYIILKGTVKYLPDSISLTHTHTHTHTHSDCHTFSRTVCLIIAYSTHVLHEFKHTQSIPDKIVKVVTTVCSYRTRYMWFSNCYIIINNTNYRREREDQMHYSTRE